MDGGGRRAVPGRGRDRALVRRVRVEPGGAVVDLWIDRAEAASTGTGTPPASRAASSRGRTPRAARPAGRRRLRAVERARGEGNAGHGAAARAGDRWRFNVYQNRPPGRARRARQGCTAWPGPRPASTASTCPRPSGNSCSLAQPTTPASDCCHEETRIAMGSAATVRACGPDPLELPSIVAAGLDEVDRSTG